MSQPHTHFGIELDRRSRRLPHVDFSNPSLWIVIGLVALPYLLFFREAIGARAFYVYDIQAYFFPYRKVAADIIASGSLPLWNPFTNAGMPLLGDGQVALFYPPNWLGYFLKPAHALSLAILSTFSIAGAGMFVFARELRFARSLAVVGALGFMFSGFLSSHLAHVSIPATAALVPAVFWALERSLRLRTAGSVLVGGLVVSIQIFAGHPQVPVYCGVAIGVYAVMLAVQSLPHRPLRESIRPLAHVLVIYIVGAMLAAIQLLPWAELSTYSPRLARTPYELFISNSVVGLDWLLILFPFGYGGWGVHWMQSIPSVRFETVLRVWERVSYFGMLPLALGLFGLFGLFDRRVERADVDDDDRGFQQHRLRAFAVILPLMLLLAAGGTTPAGELFYRIPLVGQLRAPARALAVVAFVMNVLSVYGLNRIAVRTRRVDRSLIVVAMMPLVAVGSAIAIGARVSTEGLSGDALQFVKSGMAPGNANAYVPLIISMISMLALVWLAFGISLTKVVAVAGIVAFDLGSFTVAFNPSIPSQAFSRVSRAAEFLKGDAEPFRVAVIRWNIDVPVEAGAGALLLSWAMPFGIEDINGFNSLQSRRLVDMLTSRKATDITYGLLHPARLHVPGSRVLDALDVKYALLQSGYPWNIAPGWDMVYQDEFVQIVRNPHDVRRAFFAERVRALDNPTDVFEAFYAADFNPQKDAIVEGAIDAAKLAVGMGGSVELVARSANEQTWRARISLPRLLVLSETWFPGWVAQYRAFGSNDDWRALPIYRTNYLLRGIPVPVGDNEIRLRYRPASAIVGSIVTTLTVVACVGVVFVSSRRCASTRMTNNAKVQPA